MASETKKKPAKKSAGKGASKNQGHRSNLRTKSLEELRAVLIEAQEELFNLRFQKATGNLENHRVIRRAKREIARVHTIIREMELEAATKGENK